METNKLTVIIGDDNTIIIGTELEELNEHTITIDTESKTIEGIKRFFENLIIYSFQKNIKMNLELGDSISKDIEEHTDHSIVSLIEDYITNFNDIDTNTE